MSTTLIHNGVQDMHFGFYTQEHLAMTSGCTFLHI